VFYLNLKMMGLISVAAGSSLVLTLVLGIGFVFFLRGAGKPRPEEHHYWSADPVDQVGSQMQEYLHNRAYRLIARDDQGFATFSGRTQASWGLTLFLTGLTAVGLGSLSLLLVVWKPELGSFPWMLVVFAPLAGQSYQQKSRREELIRVRIEDHERGGSGIQIRGERDELKTLASYLKLESKNV
jgi:hypothetical protein